MSIRRRWWLGAVVLLLAVAALLYGPLADSISPSANAATSAASSASMASAASAGGGSNPWGLLAQVGAEADRAEAEAAAEKAWLLDPRNDAAWCERGVPAAASSLQAHRQSSDEEVRGPAIQALREASEAVVQRWGRHLAERGDEASLAMRDFLLEQNSAAQLIQRSAESKDRFVHWLGAQRACAGDVKDKGPCRQVLERWIALEPGSQEAAMWQLGVLPQDTADEAVVRVLARVVDKADSSPHLERYLSILQSLLASSPRPGLQQAAELQVVVRAQFGFEQPSMYPLLERCRDTKSAALRGRCLAFAEQVYERDYQTTLAYLVATVVARASGGSDELWGPRHQELAALRKWLRQNSGLSKQELDDLSAGRCEAQGRLRQDVLTRSRQDELHAMRADLQRQLNPYSATPPQSR